MPRCKPQRHDADRDMSHPRGTRRDEALMIRTTHPAASKRRRAMRSERTPMGHDDAAAYATFITTMTSGTYAA
jgi:hypothetical protein